MLNFSMMSYSLMRNGDYTVEDVIDTAVKNRLDAIDWVGTHDKTATEIRKMCDDAGVKTCAYTKGNVAFRQGRPYMDDAKKIFEDAVTLGAPLVMFPPCPVKHGGNNRSEQRKVYIDFLADMAPLAEEAGVIMTIENFPGCNSPFITSSDFYEAKAQIPQLKLTFDDGNAWMLEDPVQSLKACFKDIVHVHLKDFRERPFNPDAVKPDKQQANGKYYSNELLLVGEVPTKEVVLALQELNYCGYVNIEHTVKAFPAREAVEYALALLKKILAGKL